MLLPIPPERKSAKSETKDEAPVPPAEQEALMAYVDHLDNLAASVPGDRMTHANTMTCANKLREFIRKQFAVVPALELQDSPE